MTYAAGRCPACTLGWAVIRFEDDYSILRCRNGHNWKEPNEVTTHVAPTHPYPTRRTDRRQRTKAVVKADIGALQDAVEHRNRRTPPMPTHLRLRAWSRDHKVHRTLLAEFEAAPPF